MATSNQNKTMLTIVIVLVLGIIAYAFLTMPDRRTTAERVGDAISELPNVDRAADQLEQRTPGEKIGDAIEDVGEDIKRNTNE